MLERKPSECRTCEETIFWATTDKGQNMPVDWDPVADGNVILMDDNKVHVLKAAEPVPDGAERFVSHFATCGDADVWRNR